MTDEELNARFTQLADAVTRVAETQIRFQEQVAERQARHEQILDRLTEAVEELRAANRRQERINDFLLRQQTGEN